MSGYYGYSMSNNAVYAYNNGERPFSKWTKADLLAALGELAGKYAKVPAPALKSALLTNRGWHHTAKFYNKTDFYAVDIDRAEEMTEAEVAALCAKQEKEAPPPVRRYRVSYLVWSGTRNYPKSQRHEAVCDVIGGWAITPHGKKSITGNGFQKLEEVKY